MYFGKGSFLSSSLVIGLFICDAFAGTSTSCADYAYTMAGKYKLTTKCYQCPSGCYCGGSTLALDPKGNGKPDISDSDVDKWCASGTSCKWAGIVGNCGDSNKASVNRCPSGFPYSDSGANVYLEQCYARSGSKKIFYKKVKCDAGRYLPAKSDSCALCSTSDSRYYCPGGTFMPSLSYDQGLSKCVNGEVPNDKKTACTKSQKNIFVACNPGWYLPANAGDGNCAPCQSAGDRYYCPGFTSTAMGLTHPVKGLFECRSGQVPNAQRTACISSSSNTKSSSQSGSVAKCNPGQYLPATLKQCVSCSNLDSRYYCPGGQTFSVASFDQGLKTCPTNKVADKLHTSCIIQNQPTVRCEPGQYLPATASKCTECPGDNNRYYCPGGVTFNIASFDQGVKTCAYDKEANNKKTACVTVSAIEVPAGQYLPADKVTPVKCKGSNNYCPGGQFDKESFDQGIFECPLSSRPNDTKTACTITLSKVQMQFGASGTGTPYPRQCWHQTDDPAQYISCVLANSVTGK